MRSGNFIEEYLVGLGFDLDHVGYAQFASMLSDSAHLVDQNYLSMAKSLLAFEGKSVAAFASLGAGVLTFAERTAMADQEYRLLALRMYTSLPVARELKIALDALGQPLENVIWDPELAARFSKLIEDQRIMTQSLGPDFEAQMLRIRDVRFEFTRLGVEIKYLSMLVIEDLAKAFGTDMEGVLERLRNFNEYLIHNLPAVASWIAGTLKPVLVDVKDIMFTLWELVKQLALDFTNMVGNITGNKALLGQTLDLKKFSEAVKETVQGLAHLSLGIMHVGGNLALMFDAAQQAIAGNYKAAMADFYKMTPIGVGENPAPSGGGEGLDPKTLGGGGKGSSPGEIKRAITLQATALGVPVDLALAVAQYESSYRQFDSTGHLLVSPDKNSHAMGIFQLQPGTASDMGVNAQDAGENILGGVRFLKYLLGKSHGDVEAALEHYYGSKDPQKNKEYAEKVLKVEAGLHIGSLSITVGSGDPHVVKQSVIEGLGEAGNARVQRNIAELGFPQWGN